MKLSSKFCMSVLLGCALVSSSAGIKLYTDYKKLYDGYSELVIKHENLMSRDNDTMKELKEERKKADNLKFKLTLKDLSIYEKEQEIKQLHKKYKASVKKSSNKKLKRKNDLMTKTQNQRADEIAYIVAKNYKKYGILPSVAVGQSMQETTVGTAKTSATSSYGWWGVCSKNGYAVYDSLEEGVVSYLKCLNNGRYDEALFNKSYVESMSAIQKGGYCEPSKNYALKVIECIEKFGFTEYDNYYLKE